MANFFFFTDIDLLQAQTQEQAFGPVVGENVETRYRVCSLHTATSNPNAYAVAPGSIQIQEIADSSPALVNIILKPQKQGSVSGIKVKYFIYRGILKSSLIGTSGDEISSDKTINLVDSIWKYQDNANALFKTTGNPSSQILLKTDPVFKTIEDLCNAETDFVSPCIEMGTIIGIFDKDHIGFEIVVDSFNLYEDIVLVREFDHIITNSLSNPPTFAQKSHREQVLNYIDPAAFYGMHYDDGVFVIESGQKVAKEKDALYEYILKDKFYNHNVLYFDYRVYTGFSVSFYNNYNDKIYLLFKDAITETNNVSKEDEFYCKNKWPIYTYRPNTTECWSDEYVKTQNDIYLNTETSLTLFNIYVPVGKLFDNISKKVYTNPQGQSLFTRVNTFFDNGWSQFISQGFNIVFNTYNAAQNERTLVASYSKMVFPITVVGSQFTQTHYIDNLFPIKLPIPTLETGKIKIKHTGYESYVSSSQKILALGEKNIKLTAGIYDSCIAFDANRVVLFAVPKASSEVNSEYNISESFEDTNVKAEGFMQYVETILRGNKLMKFRINTNNGEIKFLALIEKLFSESEGEVKENMLAIVLKKTEYENLLSHITTSFNTTIHPIFIQRVNVQEDFSYTDSVSNKKYKYKKITLNLKGLNNDGNIIEIPSGIDLYSSDGSIYCSPLDASEYDSSDIPETKIQDYKEGNFELELTPELMADTKLSFVFTNLRETEIFNQKIFEVLKIGNYDLKITIHAMSDFHSKISPSGFEFNENYNNATAVADQKALFTHKKLYIIFNQSLTSRLSPTYIARVLFHELVHTFIQSYPICKNFSLTKDSFKNRYGRNSALLYYLTTFDFNKDNSFNFNSDKNNEMSGDHNFMATIKRDSFIKSMKEFDSLIGINDRSGSISFENIFKGNIVETFQYSTEDYYYALSWGGLLIHPTIDGNKIISGKATREWRKRAVKDISKTYTLAIYSILIENQIGDKLTYLHFDVNGNYYKLSELFCIPGDTSKSIFEL